jgi:hypothetical protein
MHIIHHVPLKTLAMVNALVKMHITHSVLVETLVMVNPPTTWPLKHTWPWQWANVIVKMHLAYHIPIRTLVMVSILFGMHMAHKNIFNISSKTQIKINYAFGITKKVVSFPNKLFKISHKLVYNPHSSSNIKKYIHTISHMKFPTTFWNRIAYESSKCYNVFSLG